MSFSGEVREELLELKMWDNNSSLKQDEQLARLLIRESFIKKGFIRAKILVSAFYWHIGKLRILCIS